MRAADATSVLADAARHFDLSLTPTQIAQLAAYADLVHKWQRVGNLTAASTALAFVREHVVDCLAVAPYVPGPRVLDVGSGAGLPGIVLAIALPTHAFTLLEPRGKRARFLTQAKIELDLANVDIIVERCEQHRPLQPYSALVARAFGRLDRLLEATRTLQRPGTHLLAMKARLEQAELKTCGLHEAAYTTVALRVPGYADRNLVMIDCARLSRVPPPAGEAS